MNIKKIALTISILSGLQVSHTQALGFPTIEGIKTRLAHIRPNFISRTWKQNVRDAAVLTVSLINLYQGRQYGAAIAFWTMLFLPPLTPFGATLASINTLFDPYYFDRLTRNFLATNSVGVVGTIWLLYQTASLMKTPTTTTLEEPRIQEASQSLGEET